MKKFENILIISDVDGTLVDETWKISKENIAAANYFMDNGGTFTYATGRQVPVAKMIIDQLTPNAPVICYNGAAIYDYRTGEYLWTSSLDNKAKLVIDDILQNCDVVNIEINTSKGIYTLKPIDTTVARYEKFLPFFTYTDSAKNVTSPWLKIVTVCETKKMPLLREHIKTQPYFKSYQFSQSAPFLYEFLNPNVNKGATLSEFKKIVGGTFKIIAIGDNENDIEFLKAADVGFAVADGSPLLLAHSPNLTARLHDHAIADIVEKLDKNLI